VRFGTMLIAAALIAPTFSPAGAASPFHGAYRHVPAFSNRTSAQAASDVRRFLLLMDADMNGVVSKEEFMNFMSRTYDGLDRDKTGTLGPRQVRQMTVPNWLIRRETAPRG
jgi:hypothetical protein